MEKTQSFRNLDVGRLISVPIFCCLMLLSASNMGRSLMPLGPITIAKTARFIHFLLILCFYLLLILLYFLRRPAVSTTKSVWAKLLAVIATFTPFALPLAGGSAAQNPAVIIISDLLMISGMAISVYALGVLGRSFSIIPQARKLVQNGPYRLVRHPLYLGELVSIFGIVVAGFTIPATAIFALFAALQIYRALQEEKLLCSVFPEFESYRASTSLLIPGLF